MYEVTVEDAFSAAHQLRMYDGQFEPLHDHEWLVHAVFRGDELDAIDVLIDFELVRRELDSLAAELSGKRLNDVPGISDGNPSAERVARWIFDRLSERLGAGSGLSLVRLREAEGCWAAYGV